MTTMPRRQGILAWSSHPPQEQKVTQIPPCVVARMLKTMIRIQILKKRNFRSDLAPKISFVMLKVLCFQSHPFWLQPG
jgi:hypothetical protein